MKTWEIHCGAAWTLGAALLLCPRGLPAGEPPASVPPPPPGRLYHGVFSGGMSGEEDEVTAQDLAVYERAVGKKVAWVYFSNEWFRSREFPQETAAWIRNDGATPFIRLMLRSSTEQKRREKVFTLPAIIDGTFDADLRRWGGAARQFGSPLLVEYGTECNGDWFRWNGRWNGGGGMKRPGHPTTPDGPARFVAAYRHIVETIRGEGATNITWVFHVNAQDSPVTEWNRFENYYPGDDVVDWIGVSAYGPQTPMETEAASLRSMLDPACARLDKLAPDKPVALLEFGCTVNSRAANAVDWAGAALDDLLARRWPRMIGFSWWNERWENDHNPQHNTNMRVQDTPELAAVFHRKLAESTNVVETVKWP